MGYFNRSDNVYSPLGILETLRYSTIDAINELTSAKYRFTILHFEFLMLSSLNDKVKLG